jgi:hypothetical protein
VGSILGEVIEYFFFFNFPNPSSRTMDLGFTVSNRNEYQKMFLGSKARPTREADSLTATCEPIVWEMWDPRHLTNLFTCAASYGDSFSFWADAYL